MKKRGFATITTPDGLNHVWVHRPVLNRIVLCCSFSLEGQMHFIDAINDSDCEVEVHEIHIHDKDYSSIILKCLDAPEASAERLLEVLPDLMDKHLTI